MIVTKKHQSSWERDAPQPLFKTPCLVWNSKFYHSFQRIWMPSWATRSYSKFILPQKHINIISFPLPSPPHCLITAPVATKNGTHDILSLHPLRSIYCTYDLPSAIHVNNI
jgi:hypothetical protein